MRTPARISRRLLATGLTFVVRCAAALLPPAAVLLGGWASPASARDAQYVVRNWRVDDGLPSNTVNRIVQDGRGYLWFATAGGLARFDGLNFQEYAMPGVSPDGGNSIRDLVVEDARTLLALPASGGIFRVRDGVCTQHPATAALQGRQLLFLYAEPAGALWIVPGGSDLLRWERGTLRRFGPADGFNRRGHRVSFATDEKGRTWIAAADFLAYYENGTLHRSAQHLGSSITIAPARGGGFWVVAGTQLLRCRHGAFETVAAADSWREELAGLQQVIEDKDGALWFASRRYGVARFADGRLQHVPASHEQAAALALDSEGDVWVATAGGGVDRLRRQSVARLDAGNGLVDKISSSVCEDANGTLWLANRRGGLVHLGGSSPQTFLPNPRSAPFFANTVCPAADGSIWVGAEQGLFRLQPGPDGALERVADGPRNIHVLFIARDGGVWVGAGENGFGVYRDGGYHPFTSADGYSGRRVKAVAEDSHGKIIVATDDRQLYEWSGEKLALAVRKEDQPGGLLYGAVFDEDDRLWLATSHGVVLRNPAGDLHLFTTDTGLADNVVSQVLSDRAGRLWFGSARGIFSVARADLLAVAAGRARTVTAIPLGRDEGVGGVSALNNTQPMAWRAHDGRLWFTTYEGVVGIDPAASLPAAAPPRVYVEEAEVNGAPVNPGATVRIEPGGRQATFQFAALNYSAPERVRMRHRLVGYDFDWLETGPARRASYSRLPPGAYTLEVAAANADGRWTTPPVRLGVVVVPSWWQTWWARLGFVAAFTILVAGAARYWSVRRLRLRLERLEREHALEKERARIARDLHDELGGSLTQIGLLAERVRRHAGEPGVSPLLAQLAANTRRISDELESIVWRVNPGNNTWDKLAAFIDQYARGFFRDTAVTCTVSGVELIPSLPLSPEAQHNVLSVMKEALNNVLKHAQASRVSVELAAAHGAFGMRIRDNGIGFDPDAPELAEGNGLANMRTRMREVGGEVDIISARGRGTEVVVRQEISAAYVQHPTPI